MYTCVSNYVSSVPGLLAHFHHPEYTTIHCHLTSYIIVRTYHRKIQCICMIILENQSAAKAGYVCMCMCVGTAFSAVMVVCWYAVLMLHGGLMFIVFGVGLKMEGTTKAFYSSS